VFAAACGSEIGDECVVNSDCSPTGDRQCDNSSQSGYCTIQGCDFNTCPEEAACVRFFTGGFNNRACDFALEDRNPENNACSPDELCALTNKCVPRSSEVRYCMRKCSSQDDCRDGYECRDLEAMREHGGEPVLAPGTLLSDTTAPKFCAVAL
jgi:hypothetical protein